MLYWFKLHWNIEVVMSKILIADSNEADLKILELILTREGHEVESVQASQDAMMKIVEYPYDLILIDIELCDPDGYELCREIKKMKDRCEIPIIFINEQDDTYSISKGFDCGAIDYLTKPFREAEVKVRVQTHTRLNNLQRELHQKNKSLEKKVQKQVQIIADTQMATIFSLAKLAQSRDDETGLHLERVQRFCYLLTEDLMKNSSYSNYIDETFQKNILHASPLHDIGKVGIPDKILLKPGKLTAEEFEVMKTHTLIGAETLELVNNKFGNNEFIRMGIEIARYHHERWDGKGYPHKLAGTEIPLAARIMSIADVYDALRAERVYKSWYSQDKACAIIIEGSGTQFDPVLVSSFIRTADKFDKVFKEWFG